MKEVYEVCGISYFWKTQHAYRCVKTWDGTQLCGLMTIG